MSADCEGSPAALFDRLAWRRHRHPAARNCTELLHVEVAERLVERLADIGRRFHAALDWGAHSGALSQALHRQARVELVVSAEPALGFPSRGSVMRVAADLELVPFRGASFDLVASVLALHWIGDLPGALIQLRRILKPDGLFLAALFGGATLAELRTVLIEAELAEEGGASPRVSPMVELADAAALLQRAGFAMPVADADRITVTYADPLALMRDLRGMGETNALMARRRTPPRRSTLARAAALYIERFGLPDGRIPATFDILYLTGWAPDPSQPKPLPPGSASHRLADALGTAERSTGVRAAPPEEPDR